MYYICSIQYDKSIRYYYPYGVIEFNGNDVIAKGRTAIDLCKRIFDGAESKDDYVVPEKFIDFVKLLQHFYNSQYFAIIDPNKIDKNDVLHSLKLEKDSPSGIFDLNSLQYRLS